MSQTNETVTPPHLLPTPGAPSAPVIVLLDLRRDEAEVLRSILAERAHGGMMVPPENLILENLIEKLNRLRPVDEPTDPPDPRPRFGGPKTCSGACVDCTPKTLPQPDDLLEAHIAAHHFQTDMVAFSDDFGQENSEPAKLGLLAWYDCKHCEAWAEDLPEIDAAVDFVLHGPGGE